MKKVNQCQPITWPRCKKESHPMLRKCKERIIFLHQFKLLRGKCNEWWHQIIKLDLSQNKQEIKNRYQASEDRTTIIKGTNHNKIVILVMTLPSRFAHQPVHGPASKEKETTSNQTKQYINHGHWSASHHLATQTNQAITEQKQITPK